MNQKFEFEYHLLDDSNLLSMEDQELLEAAKKATQTAYAPYSNFYVGAAARLSSHAIITASNQESASFPVGICAERTLLNSIGSQFTNEKITAIAISYDPKGKPSHEPLSPCGMCRQSLLDYETRFQSAIKIIMAGKTGKVMIVSTAKHLLPFGFDGAILK